MFVAIGAAMSAQSNEPSALSDVTTAGSERPRVLVVEDQFLIAASIQAALQDLACEVLGPAPNLASAEGLLRTAKPTAAVLNYQLDGETTAELARILIHMRCPILFVSGESAQSVPEDLRACHWLEKPITGAPLNAALRALLARADSSARTSQPCAVSAEAGPR
jgi:DNA-binding response OmpR family regulator